jgi:hypothetical protein
LCWSLIKIDPGNKGKTGSSKRIMTILYMHSLRKIAYKCTCTSVEKLVLSCFVLTIFCLLEHCALLKLPTQKLPSFTMHIFIRQFTFTYPKHWSEAKFSYCPFASM